MRGMFALFMCVPIHHTWWLARWRAASGLEDSLVTTIKLFTWLNAEAAP